jgi:hypothetical protein
MQAARRANGLHGVTSQRKALLVVAAVRIFNPTKQNSVCFHCCWLILGPEYGGEIFLLNFDLLSTDYTPLYARVW